MIETLAQQLERLGETHKKEEAAEAARYAAVRKELESEFRLDKEKIRLEARAEVLALLGGQGAPVHLSHLVKGGERIDRENNQLIISEAIAADHAAYKDATDRAKQLGLKHVVVEFEEVSVNPDPAPKNGDIMLTPEQASNSAKYRKAQEKAIAQGGVVRVIPKHGTMADQMRARGEDPSDPALYAEAVRKMEERAAAEEGE